MSTIHDVLGRFSGRWRLRQLSIPVLKTRRGPDILAHQTKMLSSKSSDSLLLHNPVKRRPEPLCVDTLNPNV
jgi:hypothetical protein